MSCGRMVPRRVISHSGWTFRNSGFPADRIQLPLSVTALAGYGRPRIAAAIATLASRAMAWAPVPDGSLAGTYSTK